jgi:peptidoglycan hydrolase-like protein with peptidoglycan-binding domain
MLIDTSSVQRALLAAGLYTKAIDGDWGDGSKTAARAYLANRVPDYRPSWPDARVRVAVEQAIMADLGFYKLKIDGIAGPASQAAVEKWQDYLTFKRKPLPANELPVPPAVRNVWPRQMPRSNLTKFYGEPGQNQTMLETPYPLYLDWALSQKIEKFSIHEKCHASALAVMNRVADAYGLDKIHELGLDQFGGCLNVRKMRNGNTLSTHSWGIAIDWDADRNPLRATATTARLARPEYSKFLDLWEEEGWVSLGRARNFDWMHLQACRL